MSDAITVGQSLTINAGLRFDHSRAISQDLPALDPQGRETSDIVRGLGTLYTWNVWSPRLGVTMKLTGDGRTMLRASYGRFNQGVLTGELAPFHPGATPVTTADFDPATGGYTQLRLGGRSQNEPAIRSRRCARHAPTSTPSAWIARSDARWRVALAYVRKNGGDFIGWTDVGGQYREETRAAAGRHAACRCCVLVNSTADRRFLLTNPADYSIDVQRTRDGRRKTPVARVAGVWVLHVVESVGAAALERGERRSLTGQHHRRHRRSSRSGRIRTVSPTRAAGCQTIDRTCCA